MISNRLDVAPARDFVPQRLLVALVCCTATLGPAAPAGAATVVYDGGTGFATAILDLVVGGSHYDVQFVGGSYDGVYGLDSPTFLGDNVGADAAADAIRAVMGAEPVVPNISSFGSEVLWVPISLSSTNFRAKQVGHVSDDASWQRFADFIGSRSIDRDNGWYFTRFSAAAAAAPEPTSWLLAGAGLLGLAARRRRRAR